MNTNDITLESRIESNEIETKYFFCYKYFDYIFGDRECDRETYEKIKNDPRGAYAGVLLST